MGKFNPDIVISQFIKDYILGRRGYRLDERFVLRDGKRRPLAIVVPGGAYAMVCSYIEGVPIAKRLNELGISAVIVYYRVGKAARYPAPQEDLARAVRELLARGEELMLDTGGYSIWGASAGGIWPRPSELKAWATGAIHSPLPKPLCSATP